MRILSISLYRHRLEDIAQPAGLRQNHGQFRFGNR
jgi:hypothetical protein